MDLILIDVLPLNPSRERLKAIFIQKAYSVFFMRVAFLTPITTAKIPLPEIPPFLMPPYWAATLVSSLIN